MFPVSILTDPKPCQISVHQRAGKFKPLYWGKGWRTHPSGTEYGQVCTFSLNTPIYRPVLTRVREYDSIRFSMATVLVFPSLQYGFLGEALPTAHSSGAGGCPRPRLHFEAPTDSECSGFRIEGSAVEARVASRELMPLARNHSMVRHAAEGILFPLAIFPANRKTIAVRWKQPCPF